jgi:predicted RNA-binding Zn-ribbon protein involved in translation (DUF1610 family)
MMDSPLTADPMQAATTAVVPTVPIVRRKRRPQADAPDLSQLATQANQAHLACQAAMQSMLTYARQCGEILLQVKALVGHGHFQGWMQNNCKFSPTTARNYMVLARNWDQLLDLSKQQRDGDLTLERLSVREALRILTAGGAEELTTEILYQTCPSCGERLIVTSKLYATCGNCWECRLYRYAGAPVLTRNRSASAVIASFSKVQRPDNRALALAIILAELDPKTVYQLSELLRKPGEDSVKAAAMLARLATAAQTAAGDRDQGGLGNG